MKKMKGKLAEETGDNDNIRAKRYIAKLLSTVQLRMEQQMH
jgi:urease alpha subunit